MCAVRAGPEESGPGNAGTGPTLPEAGGAPHFTAGCWAVIRGPPTGSDHALAFFWTRVYTEAATEHRNIWLLKAQVGNNDGDTQAIEILAAERHSRQETSRGRGRDDCNTLSWNQGRQSLNVKAAKPWSSSHCSFYSQIPMQGVICWSHGPNM